jgi:hypothetical protein
VDGRNISEHIKRGRTWERTIYGKLIVAPLARQLTCSHFLLFVLIKEPPTHEFYLTIAAIGHLNTLEAKIVYESFSLKGATTITLTDNLF